jgi:hypothetical protein
MMINARLSDTPTKESFLSKIGRDFPPDPAQQKEASLSTPRKNAIDIEAHWRKNDWTNMTGTAGFISVKGLLLYSKGRICRL